MDLTNEEAIPMRREDRGYWKVTIEDCTPGTFYKYIIDGNGSYPDPASLSQPQGVHGPSELIDLYDFAWSDEHWNGVPLEEMIQYEIHTGTFTPDGTFGGIVKKLNYLIDLGINAIEIMPVSKFSGRRNWGYDGVYPFAVHDSYGGAAGLMRLVDECHNRNMAVILDVVYNHFGPEGSYVSKFGSYFSGNYSVKKTGYYQNYGEPEQLTKAMRDAFVFDGIYSQFRKKTYGNSTKGIEPSRFVIYNQNHDQVGNRKRGERLISLTSYEMAKLVAGAMFVTPGLLMLFMGEEYGESTPFLYFVSHADEKLNQLVREGREREFGELFPDKSNAPDPASPQTYDSSCLSWDIENNGDKQAMFNYYKELIGLRNTNPVLRSSNRDNLKVSMMGKIFIVERWKRADRVLVILNFEETPRSVQIPEGNSEKLNRIIDSGAKRWNGPGELSPGDIAPGDEIISAGESFVVYSNKLR